MRPLLERSEERYSKDGEAKTDIILGTFGYRKEDYVKDSRFFTELEKIEKPQVSAFSPWQQSLRAISHHLPKLRLIIVLPSVRSADQFQAFRRLAQAFFPGVELERVMDGASIYSFNASPGEPDTAYLDYDYVKDGIEFAIEQAKLWGGRRGFEIGLSDICIDITAGQKTFSIAGAIGRNGLAGGGGAVLWR